MPGSPGQLAARLAAALSRRGYPARPAERGLAVRVDLGSPRSLLVWLPDAGAAGEWTWTTRGHPDGTFGLTHRAEHRLASRHRVPAELVADLVAASLREAGCPPDPDLDERTCCGLPLAHDANSPNGRCVHRPWHDVRRAPASPPDRAPAYAGTRASLGGGRPLLAADAIDDGYRPVPGSGPGAPEPELEPEPVELCSCALAAGAPTRGLCPVHDAAR